MSEFDRRAFIKALGAGTAAAMLPASILRALAIPAHNATGTIMDVEHVVILMQENRGFDHYFGTLQGVRGFNDPRAVKLSNGNSVWYQPTGTGTDYVLPFHPTTPVSGSSGAPDLGVTFIEDLDHFWNATHQAWNNGQWDQWVPNKTQCDHGLHDASGHSVSLRVGRRFSRCVMPTIARCWDRPTQTAITCGPAGWATTATAAAPVVDNAEQGYSWSTYPEKLQAAGVQLQDLPGHRHRSDPPDGYWGYTSNPYIGQLWRYVAPVLQAISERCPGQPSGEPGAHGHQYFGRRDAVRRICRGCCRRQASAGVLGRGARGRIANIRTGFRIGALTTFRKFSMC